MSIYALLSLSPSYYNDIVTNNSSDVGSDQTETAIVAAVMTQQGKEEEEDEQLPRPEGDNDDGPRAIRWNDPNHHNSCHTVHQQQGGCPIKPKPPNCRYYPSASNGKSKAAAARSEEGPPPRPKSDAALIDSLLSLRLVCERTRDDEKEDRDSAWARSEEEPPRPDYDTEPISSLLSLRLAGEIARAEEEDSDAGSSSSCLDEIGEEEGLPTMAISSWLAALEKHFAADDLLNCRVGDDDCSAPPSVASTASSALPLPRTPNRWLDATIRFDNNNNNTGCGGDNGEDEWGHFVNM